MGALVVLLLIVLVGGFILVIGLAPIIAVRSVAKDEQSRKRSEANAPNLLDAAFDGRRDVIVKINTRSVSYETTVMGATSRGYRLVSTNDEPGRVKALVFTKD